MRRRYKTIDPNEFVEADDLNKTTIKGEMRKLYSEINRKLKEGGWSAKDVVAWFSERGLPISVELFRVYLRDLDKEHGYKRSTGEHINTPQKHIHKLSDSTPSKPQLPSATTTNKSSDTNPPQASENRKFSNPADVKKARDQEVNLDDYEE
jgi:hypothetical protein